ncbi:MAG: glycosyltransferase family 39 protein [Lentimicrobium sp.]|jgi:hypothetical protein|nr:glycosyltransferase family 39 protein [Lentimicrobium sp.]
MTLKTKFSAFFLNRKLFLIPALLVFIPLMFLNLRSDHDWGDDFAQYLAQADNIVHGKPMAATGYIYNPHYPSLGPKAYPPGFPLMIAPMVAKYGNQVKAYNYLISVLLILTALVSVLLLYKKAGWPAAILLSAMVYYNPYTLNLKAEIMADIPFALLFALFLWIVSLKWNKKTSQWIIAGVVAGLSITVKSIGIALPLALIVYGLQHAIIQLSRKQSLKTIWTELKNQVIATIISLTIYLGFNLMFMRGTSGGGYLNIYDFNKITEAFATNIYTYSEAIRLFFVNPDSPLFWIGFPAGALILAFFISGLILSISKKPGLIDWITLIYIGLLLIYPYHNSGFRFLLPLAPLILWYSLETLQIISSPKALKWIPAAIALPVLLTYLQLVPGYYIPEKKANDGPYATHVSAAFNKVKSLTDDNSRIVFIKPRALTRFAGRNSLSENPLSSAPEIYQEFASLKPTHFLLYSGMPDPALKHYLKTNQTEIRLLWRDEFFELYQRMN